MHYASVTKEYEVKALGKKEVSFTVPQGDDLDELIGPNFFRSAEELKDRTNKVIARGATQSGNALLAAALEKVTTEQEWLELVQKAQKSASAYKPEISTGISAKTAKTGVDNLTDLRTKHADVFKKFAAEEVFAFLTEGTIPDWAVSEINTSTEEKAAA